MNCCSAIPWPQPPGCEHQGWDGAQWLPTLAQRLGTGGLAEEEPAPSVQGHWAGARGPRAAHTFSAISRFVEWPHSPSSTLYLARLDMRLIWQEERGGLGGEQKC